MSAKRSFEGVVTAFEGKPDYATIDIAQNYSTSRSKDNVQKVMAALRSLGLAVRSPRAWVSAHKAAPSTPKIKHSTPKAAPQPGTVSGR
jgi:hypothetical protein